MLNHFLRSVGNLYSSINPNTLTGACDIIVVESNGVLTATPFYVRFGTLQMFRITMRTVHLIVNGELTDITMRIGPGGMLHFEVEERDELEDVEVYEIEGDLKVEFSETSQPPRVIQDDWAIGVGCRAERRLRARYTQLEFELLRSENYSKRQFMREHRGFDSDFYSRTYSYRNMQRFLESIEHLHFVYQSYEYLEKLMLGILEGVHAKPRGASESRRRESFCKGVSIRYSKSLLATLQGRPDSLFNSQVVNDLSELDDFNEIAVEVKNCAACRGVFYFPFRIFSELLFLVRNLQSRTDKKAIFGSYLERRFRIGLGRFVSPSQKRQKTYTLTDSQLRSMKLREGHNSVVFRVGGVAQQIEASIYLLRSDARLVVSDIDGTITRSDVMGHLCDLIGVDYTQPSVAQLYTLIANNGYTLVYLSTRPISHYGRTRSYLRSVSQGGYRLPDGPIILSPLGIVSTLYREMVSRSPEKFKIEALQAISALFGRSPFVAGFGNKINDVVGYRAVGIPKSKIFTIDTRGLVSLAMQSCLESSYMELGSLVEFVFPIRDSKDESFNDFEYWQNPPF